MNRSEYTLILLLRLGGTLQLLGLIGVLLPTSAMNSIHQGLGLGALPSAPIVEYLSRSLSAFYAIQGGLMWCLSFDVDRFRPIVIFLSSSLIALGLLLFAVDIWSGLPAYWIWSEGPPIVVLACLALTLALKGRR